MQSAAQITEFKKIENQTKTLHILIGTIVTGDLFVTSETKVQELRTKFKAKESIDNFKKTAAYNSAHLLINMLMKLPD